MHASNVTEAELIALIRRVSGERRKPITRGTAIYHDLQIAGDDADDLLQEIAKCYSVSFKEVDLNLYFPNETAAGWHWLRSKLGWRDNSRPPLTVEHLLAVIERGEWFPPSASHSS
jgi:Protein of unknown function (DUF1493)